MAWPLSKPMTEVTRDDLQELIGIAESDRLEFKRDAYPRKDEGTREMLRDITSLANAAGGHLLLGVEEDHEDRASEMVGMADAEDEASRMLSSCRANIEEQIIGLNFRLVPVSDDAQVLIWYIPRSTRAPHMITFKGLYQCWKRHGRQKDRMSIEEIREACLRTENIRRGLEDFLAERREKVLAQVGSDPWLWLAATPLLVKDELVDTGDEALRDLLKTQPYQPGPGGWTTECGSDVRPSLYGLVTEGSRGRRLEVFRNAHLEFRVPIDDHFSWTENVAGPGGDTHQLMYPYALAEYALSFIHLARGVADQAGIMEPIVIGLSLLNARGLGLRGGIPETPGYRLQDPGQIPTWEEDQHLELPLAQYAYPVDPGKAAKPLLDRVWNAFGHEECPVLKDDGTLAGRR